MKYVEPVVVVTDGDQRLVADGDPIDSINDDEAEEEEDRDPWKNEINVKSESAQSESSSLCSAAKRKSKSGGHHHHHKTKRRYESKEKVEQLCRVCAEQAAGYHYGVFTCEGCKSFFGRYQKGKRKPPQECMNGHGQCDVKSRARNRCRYCRYQKCLAAGMSKSASRYGRRSNWFKVHCLSEAQEEDMKNVLPRMIVDQTSEKRPSSINDHQHSPVSKKVSAHAPSPSIPICTASIINPKPLYPLPSSPVGSSMVPPSCSSLPKPSAIPLPSFLYSSSPDSMVASAFSPVLGFYPTAVRPSLHSLYLALDYHQLHHHHHQPMAPSVVRVQTPVQMPVHMPVQNEPLDLSLKPPVSFKSY